ncbi:Ankyrin repeat protein [Aphelenchoides besseyi]|nr:Ankyrin repeat protein [Aphelenchoides besseyi]
MRLPNPTKRVDGSIPVVPIASDKCNCCPFGYHIDLDFVSFATDTASGRKTADSTFQSRRQTPIFTPEELKRSRLSNGHSESASAFQSLSKKSLSDVVNDLNEIAYNPTPINSGGTLTNGTNNLTNGVSTLPPKHVSSKHIEWSPIVPSHDPIQRPNHINAVPRHLPQMPLVDMHAVYSPLDSGYRDHEYREKTPLTVSAELEVQQIFGDNRNRQLPSFRRNVTSAPTSPVQKTYYTAIGQSLAKLTNRTPVSQISRVDPIYNTTTSTPRNPFASTTTSGTSADKPPLPRRYFDGGRRNRVLSPDPETSSASPNLLRSSNLHSRTYFRPQYSDTNSDSYPRSIPYRSRLGGIGRGSTGSPLFDSFASVKRSRGLDESRSLSPTGMLDTAIYSKEQSELPVHRPSTVETQTPPYVPSMPIRKLRDSPTQTPPIPPPKVKVISSVHNESQTNRVYSKNIGIETIARDVNSVALDTVDLEQPIKKFPLSFEFQYCIGHEPESQEPIDPKSEFRKCSLFNNHLAFKKKELQEVGTSTKPPKIVDASTLCRPILTTTQTQTDKIETPKIVTMENETQTVNDWIMEEVRALMRAEKAERKSVDKKTETEEEEAGEFILITCSKCDRQPVDAAHEHYEKIRVSPLQLSSLTYTQDDDQLQKSPVRQLLTTTAKSTDSSSDPDEGLELIEPLDFDSDRREEEEHLDVERISPPTQLRSISPQFDKIKVQKSEDTRSLQSNRSDDRSFDDDEREMLANLEQLASFDPDRFSLNTDAQTVICLDANLSDGQRQLDPSRTEAIRKLLTEPNRPGAAFQRESAANRSYRVDKSKAHDLDYILDKHTTTEKSSAEPSTPDPEKALTEMVVLKKFVSHPSQFPDPVPARIPRPKFTKFASAVSEQAETADEAAEEADKLTPLRSELQYVPSWRGTRRFRHHQYPNFASDSSVAQPPEDYSDDDEETHPIDPNDPLSSSNSSLTSDLDSNDEDSAAQFEISPPLKEALATLNRHLRENKDDQMHSADWASKYTEHEWLKITTRKAANAHSIERFIETLENVGPEFLEMVVNTVDNNGNTALHFAASDDNFEAISALLDCKVCRVDETNKAGYSPVMLAALCTIKNETEAAIVQRLFERGNVNAKAVYHGQTALMLACSHGRVETTKLLLNCGADVNMQDIDGSTALMCASEHGHKDLVKLLLQQPSIDCSLTDCDDQTALSIAVENGHRDIGILIYAQLNSRGGAT